MPILHHPERLDDCAEFCADQPIPSPLPLFARHDKGTGKKVRPMRPTTGRNIVAKRVKQALARHKNIQITQKYAHIDDELDKGYHEIFERPKA
jgi:hypothetical protein